MDSSRGVRRRRRAAVRHVHRRPRGGAEPRPERAGLGDVAGRPRCRRGLHRQAATGAAGPRRWSCVLAFAAFWLGGRPLGLAVGGGDRGHARGRGHRVGDDGRRDDPAGAEDRRRRQPVRRRRHPGRPGRGAGVDGVAGADRGGRAVADRARHLRRARLLRRSSCSRSSWTPTTIPAIANRFERACQWVVTIGVTTVVFIPADFPAMLFLVIPGLGLGRPAQPAARGAAPAAGGRDHRHGADDVGLRPARRGPGPLRSCPPT